MGFLVWIFMNEPFALNRNGRFMKYAENDGRYGFRFTRSYIFYCVDEVNVRRHFLYAQQKLSKI